MLIVRFAGGLLGIACLALVVVAGAFGSADPSRNPASYLVWLYFWPGVAVLVLLIGDFWPWLSPWLALSAIAPRQRRHVAQKQAWAAVVAFSGFAWFDLASGMSNRPGAVALAALALTAFVVIPSFALGSPWPKSAEPFSHVFAAVGQLSPVQLLRGRGLRPAGGLGWDRCLLLALVLGAAIFDALTANPWWTSLVTTVSPSALQRATPPFIAMRSASLAVTSALVVCSFLIVASLLRHAESRSNRTNSIATALLPIAVSLMVAHNLPALVHLGPRLPTVLVAFLTKDVTAPGLSPDAAVPISSARPLWIAEVVIIFLGLAWSAVIAWRLQTTKEVFDRFADAYPIWALAALISGLALWILYLPVSVISTRYEPADCLWCGAALLQAENLRLSLK